MKKKILTVAGLTVVSSLALAGCKPTTTVEKGSVYNKDGYTYEEAPAPYTYSGELKSKDVNVYLNYAGTAGVSYRGTTAYPNPINGVTYQQDAILPTWVELGRVTGTNVKDVASYTDKDDKTTYEAVSGKGFKTTDGKGIDLFANSVANINTMGGDGNAMDLVPFINDGKMPNFKAYLDANPTVKKQIMVDGKIFYTPYFDGYNQVERMFIMDTEMVQILVDTDDFTNFDATLSGKGGDAKTLKEAQYQPFINADSNYAANTKVKVSKDAKAVEVEIKKTDNIIKQQNASLANGVSGKDLAKQFKDYLKAAYGHLVGKGKTFEKYSDIFVSESAAYNADELVALMRVVKANPKTVSKGLVDTVECFFPRGEAANRVANILDLAQIWGVQGLDAESNNFFFDANGKLQSLGTTQASYDALDLLSQLYKEGLIVSDFFYVPKEASSTKGLDKYFKKTRTDSEFGFLMYDYSAATGAANDTVEGIGTDPSSRNGKFKDLSVTGVRPVVSPLTMWATEKNWDRTQALSNMTGKTLTRYIESNRTLKTGSWCIPVTATNVEGALRLMDVPFSAYGALVNTFGPTDYWYVPTSQKDSGKAWIATDLGGDEKAPVLSQALTQAIQKSKKDFWSFMRENIGATHGIGGVRNNQADFQATNAHAQVGLVNVKNAIASGAIILAQVKATYDFSTSVNVNWSTKVKATADNDGITSFWTDPKTTEATNWTYVVVNGKTGEVTSGSVSKKKYTLDMVLSHMDNYAKNYLYAYANELGAEHIADFCKSN